MYYGGQLFNTLNTWLAGRPLTQELWAEWLELVIGSRQIVLLVSDPRVVASIYRAPAVFSGYWYELQVLFASGYTMQGNFMIPPP